jgi:hypothetical protein
MKEEEAEECRTEMEEEDKKKIAKKQKAEK